MYYLCWLNQILLYYVHNEKDYHHYKGNPCFTYTVITDENQELLFNFAKYLRDKYPDQEVDNLEFLWNLYQMNGSTMNIPQS